ncbi:MAG: TetR/AcrR family transcriptional regulator [Actinomycetales bacterium]
MSASPRILQATIHVVATAGLEGTSVRSVAAEAGVSIGAVQHHFKTKADLLSAAMSTVAERFRADLQARLEQAEDSRDALRQSLYALACADQDTTPAAIWTAFAAGACVDPALRSQHVAQWHQVEAFISSLVAAIAPQWSPDRVQDTAGVLLAMVDGIAVARAAETDRMPAERARRLVDIACACHLPE